MSKTNLIILLAVAAVAVGLLYVYLHPLHLEQKKPSEVSQAEVKEILLLEAYDHNVSISQKEFDAAYLGLLNKSGMSNESYAAYVEKQHGSRQAFETTLRENLMVVKLINEQVNWSRIRLDNATVDSYIKKNPNLFPAEQLNDPGFRVQFYKLAKQQMFEKQRQLLVNEYVRDMVQKHN